MSLMEQARAQRAQPQDDGGQLKKPDWQALTPPDMLDAVQRIVAAGQKLMYSPGLRDELHKAVAADQPVDQKLADNVVGLLLTMDQQAQGGLPVGALFPAAMGLLSEAADVLQAAGQQVTQEDYNDAALRMFTVIGKKLGGTDEQIMGAAQQAMGGQPADGQPQGAAPAAAGPDAANEGSPADDQQDGGSPTAENDEMAGMRQGMQQ